MHAFKDQFPNKGKNATHSHPIILLMHPIFGYMISNVLLHLSSLHFPSQPVVLFLGQDLRQLVGIIQKQKTQKNPPKSALIITPYIRISVNTDFINALFALLHLSAGMKQPIKYVKSSHTKEKWIKVAICKW